jgi:5'-3' exonuclease
MGIRGLARFLKQRAPAAYTTVAPLSKAERWALDCSCIMYRARAAGLQPVTVVAGLICKLRELGVELIVIFDGKPPAVKATTLEERRAHRTAVQKEIDSLDPSVNEFQITALQRKIPSVSSADKDAVKQLLYAAGVLFLNASGEADDLLAALYKKGDVAAVISTDMDMLPRGIGRVIVPETADAATLVSVSLDRILSTLSLTYDQFVAACVLMGSDYSDRSMNPQQAVTAIQAGRSPVRETESGKQLKGDHVTLSHLLAPTQEEKWVAGAPSVEPEALATLAATYGWPPGWQATLLAKLTPEYKNSV